MHDQKQLDCLNSPLVQVVEQHSTHVEEISDIVFDSSHRHRNLTDMRESEQLEAHQDAIEFVGLKLSHSLGIRWPSSQRLVEKDWHIRSAVKDELSLDVADAEHFDIPLKQWIIQTQVRIFAPLDQHSRLNATFVLFVHLRHDAILFEHGCHGHHCHVNDQQDGQPALERIQIWEFFVNAKGSP